MFPVVGMQATARMTAAGHKPGADGPSPRKLAKIAEHSPKKFPTGVMAGDAEPDPGDAKKSRAVLWTRYTGKKKQLRVRVRETAPRRGRLAFDTDPIAKVKDGFVHFDAGGLEPGTRYEYVFYEKIDDKKEARSPVGHFCTPIGPDELKPVVFGGTSCTFQHDQRIHLTNRNLRRAARRSDLHFFVHAGDQLYCDAPKTDPALTLSGYRKKYKHAFTRPGMKRLHEAFGMYTTWDDHEVFNGWIGPHDTAKSHKLNPTVEKPENRKKLEKIMRWGVRSFYEHQPIRKNNRTDRRLWRSFRWGQTLEIFILDSRAERNLDADKYRYMSKAQEDWLIEGLQKSEAAFKFILNSRPIGYFHGRPKPPKKLHRPAADYRWTEPYIVAQRDRILAEARKVPGVWWLSGDVHFATAGLVEPGKPKKGENRVGEVLMGPGGQWVAVPGTEKWKDRKKDMKRMVHGPPGKKPKRKRHITFATIQSNYVVIHANPAKKREKSTLDIYFYQKRKVGKERLLHHETRDYAGNKKEKADDADKDD